LIKKKKEVKVNTSLIIVLIPLQLTKMVQENADH